MSSNQCVRGAGRNGKHSWQFVKNTSVSKMTFGPTNNHGVFSLRGLYKCDCGATRVGKFRSDAPKADLRDHIGV